MAKRHWMLAAAAMLPVLGSAPAGAEKGVTPQIAACKLIHTVEELQGINNDPAGSYCLANDIDAGAVADFVPIQGFFTGKFFGNSFAIRNLSINQPDRGAVGLFRRIGDAAVIQDVRLENVNIIGGARTGGLVGWVEGDVAIKNVHVSGEVRCETPAKCHAGGIVGVIEACGCVTPALTQSSSSAAVAGNSNIGGAVGVSRLGYVSRVVATGPVTCLATDNCAAGGLIGLNQEGFVERSAATGAVDALLATAGHAGGLVGRHEGFFGYVLYGYSSGRVSATNPGVAAGGLVGSNFDALIEQSLSVGVVSGGGGPSGGLVANDPAGGAAVFSSYWDTLTSRQPGSVGGTGLPTRLLRDTLPVDFDTSWAITPNKSYPFLSDPDTPFTPALASLVGQRRVSAFLPISQLDAAQYATPPAHADAASLATVYTMIARAIGITRNIAALEDAKIDTYFWNDATQTTTWKGPAARRATLGTLTDIPANVPLNNDNVIGRMRLGDLVVLRGSVPGTGGPVTHWMLGTLYTVSSGGGLAAVVAHDPWSGRQVVIDPNTKTVVGPAGQFPLSGFTVDGYQPVTLN